MPIKWFSPLCLCSIKFQNQECVTLNGFILKTKPIDRKANIPIGNFIFQEPSWINSELILSFLNSPKNIIQIWRVM